MTDIVRIFRTMDLCVLVRSLRDYLFPYIQTMWFRIACL